MKKERRCERGLKKNYIKSCWIFSDKLEKIVKRKICGNSIHEERNSFVYVFILK